MWCLCGSAWGCGRDGKIRIRNAHHLLRYAVRLPFKRVVNLTDNKLRPSGLVSLRSDRRKYGDLAEIPRPCCRCAAIPIGRLLLVLASPFETRSLLRQKPQRCLISDRALKKYYLLDRIVAKPMPHELLPVTLARQSTISTTGDFRSVVADLHKTGFAQQSQRPQFNIPTYS
jgi:hypothetical protein